MLPKRLKTLKTVRKNIKTELSVLIENTDIYETARNSRLIKQNFLF